MPPHHGSIPWYHGIEGGGRPDKIGARDYVYLDSDSFLSYPSSRARWQLPLAEASLEQKERFNRFLPRVLAHAYNRTTHVQSDREPKAQM